MAAGGEKKAIGKRRRIGEPRRERMRFEMIDGDQRLVVHQRDRLGRGQPDDEPADQARPGGRGDAVERIEGKLRFRHRRGDDVVERLDMGAGGDLGHHAAEFGVLADLRENDVGQNPAAAVRGPLDQGRGRLVAGRLDAEDDHRCLDIPRRRYYKPFRTASPEYCKVQWHKPRPEHPSCASARAARRWRSCRRARCSAGSPLRAASTRSGSRSRSSAPRATRSRTGRWPKPAARGSSPRKSRRRSCPARSTSPCIPRRTCRPYCRRASCCRRSCRAKMRATRSSAASFPPPQAGEG